MDFYRREVLVATHGNGIYRACFTPPITGMSAYKKKVEFEICPNPVRNQLRLQGPATFAGARYRIFDPSGRMLRSGIPGTSGNLPLGAMAPGLYFLHLESKTGEGVRAFIKAE